VRHISQSVADKPIAGRTLPWGGATAAALACALVVGGCGGGGDGPKPLSPVQKERAAVRKSVVTYFRLADVGTPPARCAAVSRATRRSLAGLAHARGLKRGCTALIDERVVADGTRATIGEPVRVKALAVRGPRANVRLATGGSPVVLKRDEGDWGVSLIRTDTQRDQLKLDTICSRQAREAFIFSLPPVERAGLEKWLRRAAALEARHADELQAAKVRTPLRKSRARTVAGLRGDAAILRRLAARTAAGGSVLDALKQASREYDRSRAIRRASRRGLDAECAPPEEADRLVEYRETRVAPACRRARRAYKKLDRPQSPDAIAAFFDRWAGIYRRLRRDMTGAVLLTPDATRLVREIRGTLGREARVLDGVAAAARRRDQAAFDAARAQDLILALRAQAGFARFDAGACRGL
jgi:hypothetical protein